jgi:hypothetical protein
LVNITADTFVISWANYGYDGSLYTAMARAFYNNGTPIAVEFQVNTYTDSDQRHSSVASFDDQNYFVISWQSAFQDGSSLGMFAQLYVSHSINAIGDEFQINTYTDGNQYTYNIDAVATISSNAFVVSWHSAGQDSDGSFGVYAQRFFLDAQQITNSYLNCVRFLLVFFVYTKVKKKKSQQQVRRLFPRLNQQLIQLRRPLFDND